MNAGRKYLSVSDLTGKVFLSSGLGGMSGAQAKAAVIAGCIGVIAEVIHVICDTLSGVPHTLAKLAICYCIHHFGY